MSTTLSRPQVIASLAEMTLGDLRDLFIVVRKRQVALADSGADTTEVDELVAVLREAGQMVAVRAAFAQVA